MFIRALIIFFSICQFAFAHELKPAVANLELFSQSSTVTFELKIRLNLESIIAGIEANHENTDQSPNSKKYEKLRRLAAEELIKEFNNMKQTFFDEIYFVQQNQRIPFVSHDVLIKPVGDVSLARESEIILRGTISSNLGLFSFRWKPSYGATILRVNHNSKELFTKYLKMGETASFTMQRNNQSFASVVKDYILIGFQHIMPKGLDHILFVVGLFLLSTKLRPLVWQISAFTVAHTLTIFLGVLQIIKISPSIVEPIIAISISYIAIENIFFKDLTKWRPLVVFIFGLLHGLGFAGILNEIGVSPSYLVTSLISFNIGVELGQLAVIIICFALIGFWFGSKSWYRTRLTIPLSALIAIIGFFWFVQRVVW